MSETGMPPETAAAPPRMRPTRLFGRQLLLQEPADSFTAEDGAWRAAAIYEPFLAARPLPQTGVAIDIGAAHGAFAVPFAAAHPGWTVWCFEPDPLAFATLCANIAAQELRNVVALNLAVAALPVAEPLPAGGDPAAQAAVLTAAAQPFGFRQHRDKRGYVEIDQPEPHPELAPVSFPTSPAALLAGLAPTLVKITAPGCEAGILAALGACDSLTHVMGELWRHVPAASLQRADGGHREVHLPLAGTPFRLTQTADQAPRRAGLDVVVAMYNAAAYIRDCIDGIIGNDSADIRALVVDDGSTDDSAAVVEAAYADNPRVMLLRKPNGGCASARNFGRLYSKATHIAFVDADDRMDGDLYPGLLELARYTGAEVVQGGFAIWQAEEPGSPLLPSYEDAQFRDWGRHALGPRGVFMVPAADLMVGQPTIWRRVYRRDFLDTKKIWFPEHIRAFDDQIFQMLTLHHAGSIPCLDGPRYHYRQHPGQDIRAGDERFFYSLEMFRLMLKRGLAEGWNDFRPLLRSYINTVNWIEAGLRADLRPLFIEGAAELWVWIDKALGHWVFDGMGPEVIANPDFMLHVRSYEMRLAGLGPSFVWGYLDSGLMHVDAVRARVAAARGA